MSSFFTNPASKKKRKREDVSRPASSKRRIVNSTTKIKPSPVTPSRDESSSSEASGAEDDDASGHNTEKQDTSSSSDEEDETAAERRLRLAEQYLKNIKNEVDEAGFDAEDVDRDLLAERLQEDVAETKGKLHKFIASSLDFSSASQTTFRARTRTLTAVAVCPPYAYTASKDSTLIKWQLIKPPQPRKPSHSKIPTPKMQKPTRRRPIKLLSTSPPKPSTKSTSCKPIIHHTSTILCIAASTTGQFVATGGADRQLIIWSATDLKPLKAFTQHRDSITGLAFRPGTNQLYSSSKDRTIKTWSLNEMAYVETLFGHQDEVVDVAAGVGGQERCISVGARDRTARLWKVVDETQLVFRGPSKSIINAGVSDKALSIHSVNGADPQKKQQHSQPSKGYAEGSLDCVCVLDNETFVTGSDAGTLCLWHISKKKPIHSIPLAHGLDPALPLTETSAERDLSRVAKEKAAPERQPRWITALATIPGTDVVVSGSWDGVARVWRVISPQAPGRGYGQVPAPKGMLEAVGMLGERTAGKTGDKVTDGISGQDEPDDPSVGSLKGIVNDLSVFERGKRGEESLCVVAAVGTEHRLGRWKKLPTGKSGAVIFEVPQKWKGQASRKQKQKQRKRKKKREGEADFPEPSWPVESDTEVS